MYNHTSAYLLISTFKKQLMTFTQVTSKLCLIILAVLVVISCTTTITKIKNPVFGKSIDSLQVNLSKIVTCENVDLDGLEINTNGEISTVLEIHITNGQNIPTDDNQLNELGKQIATEVKGVLQDKNEYQTYEVLFITKTENAGITRKTWKGKIFKTEEL